MVWIKYKYINSLVGNEFTPHKPLIEIELSRDGKSITQLGLIDSGCTTTIVNAEIADFFGIDEKKCIISKVEGVNAVTKGFISKLNFKLKDFADSFESDVIFMHDLPVAVLLGQNNFFEKFKIKFEKSNNIFELNKV